MARRESVWDTTRGVAVDGPLKGTLLQQLPYVTSFDWAWLDFFPHTEVYGGDFVDQIRLKTSLDPLGQKMLPWISQAKPLT